MQCEHYVKVEQKNCSSVTNSFVGVNSTKKLENLHTALCADICANLEKRPKMAVH